MNNKGLRLLPLILAMNSATAQVAEYITHDASLEANVAYYTSHIDDSEGKINELNAPRRWASNRIVVDFSTNSNPLSDSVSIDGVKHSLWSWSQGTGLEFVLNDQKTNEYGGTSNKITINWVDKQDLLNLGTSESALAATRVWYYVDSGFIASAVVYLDRASFKDGLTACNRYIISHEIGHAIGINGHTSSTEDLMYPYRVHCRYALSVEDIKAAGYKQNLCYSEIMHDGSVYIANVGALLKPSLWFYKVSKADIETSSCKTVELSEDGTSVMILDIRGRIQNYNWATLSHEKDDLWRVTGGE